MNDSKLLVLPIVSLKLPSTRGETVSPELPAHVLVVALAAENGQMGGVSLSVSKRRLASGERSLRERRDIGIEMLQFTRT